MRIDIDIGKDVCIGAGDPMVREAARACPVSAITVSAPAG